MSARRDDERRQLARGTFEALARRSVEVAERGSIPDGRELDMTWHRDVGRIGDERGRPPEDLDPTVQRELDDRGRLGRLGRPDDRSVAINGDRADLGVGQLDLVAAAVGVDP